MFEKESPKALAEDRGDADRRVQRTSRQMRRIDQENDVDLDSDESLFDSEGRLKPSEQSSRASRFAVGRWYEMSPTFPSTGAPMDMMAPELLVIGKAIEDVVIQSYSQAQIDEALREPDKLETLNQALKPVGEALQLAGKKLVYNAEELKRLLTEFFTKAKESIITLGDKVGNYIVKALAEDPNQHPKVKELAKKIKAAEKELAGLEDEARAADETPKALSSSVDLAFSEFKAELRKLTKKGADKMLEDAFKKSFAEIPDPNPAIRKAAWMRYKETWNSALKKMMDVAKKVIGSGDAQVVTDERARELAIKHLSKRLNQVRLYMVDGQYYQWAIPAGGGTLKGKKFSPKVGTVNTAAGDVVRETNQDSKGENRLILENHRRNRGKVHPAAKSKTQDEETTLNRFKELAGIENND